MCPFPYVLLVAGVAACSDPNSLPDAQITNVVDTFTISALTGTPIASPSAYSIADRAPILRPGKAVRAKPVGEDAVGRRPLAPRGPDHRIEQLYRRLDAGGRGQVALRQVDMK